VQEDVPSDSWRTVSGTTSHPLCRANVTSPISSANVGDPGTLPERPRLDEFGRTFTGRHVNGRPFGAGHVGEDVGELSRGVASVGTLGERSNSRRCFGGATCESGLVLERLPFRRRSEPRAHVRRGRQSSSPEGGIMMRPAPPSANRLGADVERAFACQRVHRRVRCHRTKVMHECEPRVVPERNVDEREIWRDGRRER